MKDVSISWLSYPHLIHRALSAIFSNWSPHVKSCMHHCAEGHAFSRRSVLPSCKRQYWNCQWLCSYTTTVLEGKTTHLLVTAVVRNISDAHFSAPCPSIEVMVQSITQHFMENFNSCCNSFLYWDVWERLNSKGRWWGGQAQYGKQLFSPAQNSSHSNSSHSP